MSIKAIELKPKPVYEMGDCRVRHVGNIELKDGCIYNGAIVDFPAGPPDLPFSVIWDETPVRMTLKSPTPKSKA